ncbi:nucleotidyltransferase domain-containing protein [Methanocalculus sp. MSAO_Arc2]|uniref:nucleotidyltransferase domain-containing protein n=1 Tax=Methanocalculus sp. MSAO_Arc2 TaxID=2293855 RepID=UPI0026C0ED44
MTSFSSQGNSGGHDIDEQMRERIIGEIVRVFACDLDLTADVIVVYIFGSFLKSNRFNDIDIGVLVSGERKPYDYFKYGMRIASVIEQHISPRCEVDLRILNGAPVRFLYEVIQSGRLVFARDEDERSSFEADVLTQYLD